MTGPPDIPVDNLSHDKSKTYFPFAKMVLPSTPPMSSSPSERKSESSDGEGLEVLGPSKHGKPGVAAAKGNKSNGLVQTPEVPQGLQQTAMEEGVGVANTKGKRRCKPKVHSKPWKRVQKKKKGVDGAAEVKFWEGCGFIWT